MSEKYTYLIFGIIGTIIFLLLAIIAIAKYNHHRWPDPVDEEE